MQENAGAWLGSQIGAPVWMIVAGILTAVRDLAAGLVVVLLFLIPKVVGPALLMSRELSCYALTQLLIGVAVVCSLATFLFLERLSAWMQIQTGGQVSAESSY